MVGKYSLTFFVNKKNAFPLVQEVHESAVWDVGCGVWGVECGVWGVGCVVCGVWCVVCGVWSEAVAILDNTQPLCILTITIPLPLK